MNRTHRHLPKPHKRRMLKKVKRQPTPSFRTMKYIIPIIAVIIGITGNILFSLFRSPASFPHIGITKPTITPTPTIHEQIRILSKEEQATMSGNFIKELSTYLASPSSAGR